MKSITEMSVEEIIVNARDNAGTDAYVVPESKEEMTRQEDLMTAYWYARSEQELKQKKADDADWENSLSSFGIK